ncbi:MAG: ABC transporter permease subunit [Actinophytocola sp.]|nr:ABC transporter permease subunit [Actinophytocola sp.]
MIAVAAWPIIHAVVLSLQRYDLRFPGEREFVGLGNYAAVLSNGFWWTAVGVTVVIIGVSVALELMLGLVLALMMHRSLVGRGVVRTVLLIPYGIVTVVAAYSWLFAWSADTGYLSRLFGPETAPLSEWGPSLVIIIIAEVWKAAPFVALLLMGGLALVPADMLQMAAMDGATRWQRFSWVTLPAMKPAIGVACVFSTLNAFRIFDTIFVLTRGANDTGSVAVLTYNNLFRGLNLGIASTMSVLIFLAAALIVLVLLKVLGVAAPGDEDRGR